MPEVLFGFGALVDGEVGGRPRVTVQADLVVLGEVVVERRLPGALAVAPVLVLVPQLAGVFQVRPSCLSFIGR